VPLIRQLSLVALTFLIFLITIALSGNVSIEYINKGLLESSDEILLLNQLFLICCAGLGASFSGLFQANSFIASNNYDPKFDSSYWSRLIVTIQYIYFRSA